MWINTSVLLTKIQSENQQVCCAVDRITMKAVGAVLQDCCQDIDMLSLPN